MLPAANDNRQQIIDASLRGRAGRRGSTHQFLLSCWKRWAAKAFGDMGPIVQLRLIRDRFVDGHDNCAL